MNLAQGIDFNSLMEPVALRLLGEPAQKHGHEWRYGNRGSLSIDLAKGHWFDHEANTGGGVFDLIKRQGHEEPAAWLRREGLLARPQVVGRPQPRIVKTYGYCDKDGTLLFQVVRFEPKGFRQRRPDGRGGWIWNLQDTRRVPYLLPDLVKAVAAGETIYVPEGEKDVDNLRAIGFAATTNPGGCKKWRSEYSEHLRGADVVVLPDNHLEGRKHGDQVVASLHGIARRIRVLDIGKHWAECPDKGDISAWLAVGGSAEKLKAIVGALPEVPTSADNPSSEQKSADDWLAAFAKKSQEALAKREMEKQTTPRPEDEVLIEALARKDHTEYDRMRSELAETLGIRVGTLDDKVEAIRKKLAAADDNDALPHWNVEPWPEAVDGDALLDSIRRVFRRYIVLPRGADIALPLWVLHAWTYDAGDVSPFMVLVSPTKRCGKTNTLILLLYLTPRSELSSNITGPALFRYIEQAHPTLLIDEADSFVKDNEELRGVLNSGHTKAAAYVRRTVEENGEHKTRRFSTWTPKAIATIRGLADTLDDRAVTLMLQRKPPGARVERLRKHDNQEFKDLRRQAARWAADNLAKLVDPDPPVPEILNDRAADNWRPLLAIADVAGGDWPTRAREAACTLSGDAQDSAIGVELLKDIRKAFGEDDEIRSIDLVAKLVADPERPWKEWKHGRDLTQKQLGGLLRPFGITSETVSATGFKDAKGYKRAHFEDAWDA